ncbi:MAG: hypothetical protein QOF48_118 [Verrucomicrobiota bacterium]
MVALGLTAIVAIVLVTISLTTGRTLSEMFNYIDLDHYNRIALDTMSRDLRQVRYLSGYTTNSIRFVDQNSNSLSFAYSATNRLLVRVQGGVTNTLLRDCDFLEFGVFQRTPQSNSFELYASTDITNCKVVSVKWSCSRSLFGLKANTEQGQTARIVIRNKKEDDAARLVKVLGTLGGGKTGSTE